MNREWLLAFAWDDIDNILENDDEAENDLPYILNAVEETGLLLKVTRVAYQQRYHGDGQTQQN